MSTFTAVGRKLKGKAQQVQGSIQQNTGDGLKGGLQKLKGKANEFIADLELENNKIDNDRVR